MGHGASKDKEKSSRRYVYQQRAYVNGTKPPRAIPSAYIPPNDTQYIITEKEYITVPEDVKVPNGDAAEPVIITSEKDIDQTVTDVNDETGDDKQKSHKTNGYIKNSKNKKGNEHIVQKEKMYKLYEPEQLIQTEGSVIYRDIDEPEIISRPRSYIHYEPRRSGYIVREKKHIKRSKGKKRIAHAYGTWRTDPEIITTRPSYEVVKSRPSYEVVQSRPSYEVVQSRPASEIITTQPRVVRVIRSVPSVRSHSLESRPVVVRRVVSPERVLTTPAHGYIPRHTLGRYKPKVIEEHVGPTNIGERVVLDGHFSDPGGYREVLVETVNEKRTTIPPPAYEETHRAYEKQSVTVEETDETYMKKQSDSDKNSTDEGHAQTDDQKLDDGPMTQYFDDGKKIMIIDYLLPPNTRIKKVPAKYTSTPRYQNGDILLQEHIEPQYSEVFITDSHRRQRVASNGDDAFLP